MSVDPNAPPASPGPRSGAGVRARGGSRPRRGWRPVISVAVFLSLLLGGTGAGTVPPGRPRRGPPPRRGAGAHRRTAAAAEAATGTAQQAVGRAGEGPQRRARL